MGQTQQTDAQATIGLVGFGGFGRLIAQELWAGCPIRICDPSYTRASLPDGRRVPITFVGGYLGAGKTTAINEVLTVARRPIAVIVNDAGAINIDASLIKGCDGASIELTDGCVCCTSIDDIGAALDSIRARLEPPDHVVIELSGVAEPANCYCWRRAPLGRNRTRA